MTYVDPVNIAGRLLFLKEGVSITKTELLDAIDYIHKKSIDDDVDVLIRASDVDTSIRCAYDWFNYDESNGMISLAIGKTKIDLKELFNAYLPMEILIFLSESMAKFVNRGKDK